MADYNRSHKRYQRLLRALQAGSAAASTRPRVYARRMGHWFPSVLLSDYPGGDGRVRVLSLGPNGVEIVQKGFSMGMWAEWPRMSAMPVDVTDVRVLATPEPAFEKMLAEMDLYFASASGPGDKTRFSRALEPVTLFGSTGAAGPPPNAQLLRAQDPSLRQLLRHVFARDGL